MADLKLGASAIDSVYLGASQVDAIYKGATLVWSGGFNPATLSPLAWWDSSQGVTSDGNGVSSWIARVGGYNAAQSNNTNKPSYASSLVTFDGTTDFLDSNLSLHGFTAFTVVLYFNWLTGAAVHSSWGESGTAFKHYDYNRISDGLLGFGINGVNDQVLATGIALGLQARHYEYSSGSFKRAYVNNVVKINATQTGAVSASGIFFALGGRRTGTLNAPMNISLKHAFVFNKTLDVTERTNLYNYLIA